MERKDEAFVGGDQGALSPMVMVMRQWTGKPRTSLSKLKKKKWQKLWLNRLQSHNGSFGWASELLVRCQWSSSAYQMLSLCFLWNDQKSPLNPVLNVFSLKRTCMGAEETACWSCRRPGSVPSIPWWLTTTFNYRFKDPTPSSGLCRTRHTHIAHIYMQAKIFMHIRKKISLQNEH